MFTGLINILGLLIVVLILLVYALFSVITHKCGRRGEMKNRKIPGFKESQSLISNDTNENVPYIARQVAWNDESNPAQGFKYLYLSAEDYERLAPGTVIATEVVERGEKRYALSDIIGRVRCGTNHVMSQNIFQ